MQLPTELAEAIGREAAQHDRGALARAVAAMSNRYHAEGTRATGRLSDVERAAYLAVRMPAIHGVLRDVFAEVSKRIPDASPQSLLDLGAGPGTAAWAARATWPDLAAIACIERDREFIAIGRRIAPIPEIQWIEANLNDNAIFSPADLVILSYTAGEFNEYTGLIERAWAVARLALIVVEPGTPRGFEVIRAVRDQLIKSGAEIAAPCPHNGECPMKKPDWCHFAARIERTRLHRQLKGGELGHEDEKFSYIIASRVPVHPAESRIVRHPWTQPGLVRLELCTQDGLRTQTIRKRGGEQFRRARKSNWGGEWQLSNHCDTNSDV
jgi:ribosomal protein RSM22 (predicted rRNA methylase)